jgi:UDP-N-acetyl-alpha-D-muramoyl-L-alanyl-L-glutamate epimerase
MSVGGVPVNHQYSKSYEFEQLFAAAAAEVGVTYFSLTRQLSELATVAAVAALPLREHILSCNRSYTQRHMGGEATQRWCLHCDKCLFTFLMFAVFLTPAEAERMFGGNPLADPPLADGFRVLWATDKPFDCVGERAESAAAMAQLAGTRAWGGQPVVAELGDEAAAFAADTGSTVAAFLPPRGPHAVPEEHLAVLQRVLADARPPVE